MNNGFDQYGRPMYFAEGQNACPPRQTYAPRVRKTCDTRDMVFVLICLVVSIFTMDFLFWAGAGAGISLCAAAILAVTLGYLSKKGMRAKAYSVILCLVYLALSASLSFSDGGLAKFIAFVLMAVTYTEIILEGMSLRRFDGGSFRSVADILYALFALTFGKIGRTLYATSHKKDGELIISRKTGSIFIGIAFALPVLCIIIPLLASSDAAFDGLLDKITMKAVFEIIGAIIIGAFFFILWFGQILNAGDVKREKAVEKAERKGVEPTVIASFLSVISIAYMLYIFSQLAYFFDAFAGFLPEGFTLSEYARRGFFEMGAICAINLFLVFLAMIITRKRDGKVSMAVRFPASFLCVFSMLLIATSLSKMILYINSYGMTRLRIYTSVFMIFLAVVFASVVLRLYIKKMPYMKAAIVAASLLVSLMCFVDVDGVIAKYNVEAYLDGRLETVDMNALGELSSAAVVPYVFELIDDEHENTSVAAKRLLSEYAEKMFDIGYDEKAKESFIKDSSYDFRRYNIPEYKAREILLENFDQYYTERYPRFDIEAAEGY